MSQTESLSAVLRKKAGLEKSAKFDSAVKALSTVLNAPVAHAPAIGALAGGGFGGIEGFTRGYERDGLLQGLKQGVGTAAVGATTGALLGGAGKLGYKAMSGGGMLPDLKGPSYTKEVIDFLHENKDSPELLGSMLGGTIGGAHGAYRGYTETEGSEFDKLKAALSNAVYYSGVGGAMGGGGVLALRGARHVPRLTKEYVGDWRKAIKDYEAARSTIP